MKTQVFLTFSQKATQNNNLKKEFVPRKKITRPNNLL